jgi:hypothetical protein
MWNKKSRAVVASGNYNLRLFFLIFLKPELARIEFYRSRSASRVRVMRSSVMVRVTLVMLSRGVFHFIFLKTIYLLFLSKSASTLNIHLVLRTMNLR